MKKRKKVLMISVNGLGNGGVQAVMMSIIRKLNNDIQFDVISLDKREDFYRKEIESQGKVFDIDLDLSHSGMKWYINIFLNNLKLYFGVKKIISSNGPYVAIHTHTNMGICLLAAVHKKITKRIAHSHLANVPVGNPNFIRRNYSKICVYLTNKYSTDKIACSNIAGKELYGNNNYKVIKNAIDLEKFKYNPSSSLNNLDYCTYINVGRFAYQKNQLFIIDIFNEILKIRKNDRLILVGYGEDEEKIKEYISRLKLEDSITILPGNSDIPTILNKSDIMIFPSNYEGLGIAVVEAQSVGLSCFVSTKVPNEANVGGCIFLDLRQGKEVWAQTIIKHINNIGLKKKKYNLSTYDIERISIEYKRLYLD